MRIAFCLLVQLSTGCSLLLPLGPSSEQEPADLTQFDTEWDAPVAVVDAGRHDAPADAVVDGAPIDSSEDITATWDQFQVIDTGIFVFEAGPGALCTVGATCSGGLTCQCCGSKGPMPICLCSKKCFLNSECPGSLPQCNTPPVGGVGVCTPNGFNCCWMCL